jgi:integrase
MRLTTASLDGLKLDAGVADKIFFDDGLPGFGIRLRASGARSWVYQYKIGGRTRRLVLGTVDAIKPAKAREIAGDLHAQVRLGGDPAAQKREKIRQASNAFGTLTERFLEQYRARPRSRSETERYLKKSAASLHAMPVDSITLRDVASLLGKIDKEAGSVSANRARAALSSCFAWAMREGLASSNPVIGTNTRQEQPRDRVLSTDEIRRVWNAIGTGEDTFGAIVKLLILTGQRRSEIGDLLWSEIDFANCEIRLSGARTKNKRQHVIPLAPTARALLDGLYVACRRKDGRVFGIPRWNLRKDEVDERSGVTDWVLHDIRRSVATGMADIGIQPHVIEAVLNHVSGHKGGVAGIYNRSSYGPEKAEALARWDKHVASIVGGV